jgi:hypothetical protein
MERGQPARKDCDSNLNCISAIRDFFERFAFIAGKLPALR